ncbi:hypothetical protein N8085_01550 [Salibacteraceae bacterium]|nr:hypothetical protein [Salibacteraceae bacterium]MDC1204069.1 hypothetical protein [Salibacteraceae bacterium]
MKISITLLSLFLAINFIACEKDQTCTCTSTSSATADGEPFPLYEAKNTTETYDKKMKDTDADEWCTSFEDSTTTAQSSDGFNYEVFSKTTCNL